MITNTKQILATLTAVACVGTASAGTIDSAAFNAVTNANVDTAGTLDSGYFSNDGNTFDGVYNNVPFTGLGITTGGSASVTLTENDGVNDAIQAQTNDANITFDGNATFGSYGGFAPGEADIWTMTFNDLGIGTFTISLYMGHSANNRIFNMDVNLSDSGGNDSTTTVSPQIGTLGSTVAAYGTSGSSYSYDVTVTTTAADADLSLTFGSQSGSFGGATFSGYTVTGGVIPEPGSLALLGLGGLMIARRRR